MCFLTTHWLPSHAVPQERWGRRVSFPGNLAGVRSRLSAELEQPDRTGDWNAVTMQGSPMLSNQLKRVTQGYNADAAAKRV